MGTVRSASSHEDLEELLLQAEVRHRPIVDGPAPAEMAQRSTTVTPNGLGVATRRHDDCTSEHIVQFYETDAFLLDALASFFGAALRAGEAVILVATDAHRAGFEERLEADGLDLARRPPSGQYVALGAAETLASFMVDGAPDPTRFAEVIGG